MGYWLEDADGEWLGDLATNRGIGQLREAGSSALRKFLEVGEANEELVREVIKETKELTAVSYVAEMLRKAQTPVFVTDGCGFVEDEEGQKHLRHDQSTHGRGGGGRGRVLSMDSRIDNFITGVQGGLQDNPVEVYQQLKDDPKLAIELKRRSIKYLGGNLDQELIVYRTTKAPDFGSGVPKYASWTTDREALKRLAESGMGVNAVKVSVKVGDVAVAVNAFTDKLHWQREVLLDRSVGIGKLQPIDPLDML